MTDAPAPLGRIHLIKDMDRTMNTTHWTSVHLIALACFLGLSGGTYATITTTNSAHEKEYTRLIDVLKQFADLDVKPGTSFDYWIAQMSYHVNNEQFAPFEAALRKALRRPKAKKLLKVFMKHRSIFNLSLRDLRSIGTDALKAAFGERLKQHTQNKPAALSQQNTYLVAIKQCLDRTSTRKDSDELKHLQRLWLTGLMDALKKTTRKGSLASSITPQAMAYLLQKRTSS